jgi:hypothetical protein
MSTSRPKVALTPRTFITSPLSQSTTEPVMRNRITNVVIARNPTAAGGDEASDGGEHVCRQCK